MVFRESWSDDIANNHRHIVLELSCLSALFASVLKKGTGISQTLELPEGNHVALGASPLFHRSVMPAAQYALPRQVCPDRA